ncbi:hypothetical protein [Microbacterium thalassium]|uniref:Uncharacterized protein n=1 Tax=Microbacterium thalassium TaxID=362649 RepID=A0A7X0KTY3_9MICO|nr:hypothetical protein [Microbacterium thalassium]MBB6390587.1 hypothetical protein [Microbacterium thalassium]
MTEPQVWTIIGVFAAAMFGMITIVSTLFIQVMRSEFGGMRSEFRRLEGKVDNLDRDVQALMRHTFGIDRD